MSCRDQELLVSSLRSGINWKVRIRKPVQELGSLFLASC